MLTRILADNFRALVNFEFRPGKLCLLLGDNSSGKSSLFEVLASISDLIVRGRPVAELFQGSQTRWDTRDVQRFELDVEGEEGMFRYALEIKQPQENVQSPQPPTIRSEVVTCNGDALYRFADGEVHLHGDHGRPNADFPFQSNQSFLANLDTRAYRLGWFKSFVEGIRILQPNPFGMEKTTRQEFPILDRWCRTLPSYFAYLNGERPDVRSELETRLREVMPGFLNFKLPRQGEDKLLLAVFENQKGQLGLPASGAQGAQGPQGDQRQKPPEFGLLELSEGQRVLIAIYAALYGMLGPQSLLCFDEPDNFVSLPEVQPWLQELRDSLEQRGGQAMVISHHPEVIDYLAVDSAWRFERPAGAVVARELDFASPPELKPSEIIARGG
jgi:energy-coupling factor transporter ATP-binding protein EcfA2